LRNEYNREHKVNIPKIWEILPIGESGLELVYLPRYKVDENGNRVIDPKKGGDGGYFGIWIGTALKLGLEVLPECRYPDNWDTIQSCKNPQKDQRYDFHEAGRAALKLLDRLAAKAVYCVAGDICVQRNFAAALGAYFGGEDAIDRIFERQDFKGDDLLANFNAKMSSTRRSVLGVHYGNDYTLNVFYRGGVPAVNKIKKQFNAIRYSFLKSGNRVPHV